MSENVNPWSSNDILTGVRLGNPRGGLVLARRFRLLSEEAQCRTEASEGQMTNSSSMKLIRILQEMSEVSEELNQIELELHRHLLDRETADLLHVDVLQSRLRKVDSLLGHLSSVTGSKDLLLGRLQSRTTENSLKIEATCQRHMAELLLSVDLAISELPANCRRLQWARDLDLRKTTLEEKLSRGVQTLAQCKAAYCQCQELHNLHHRDS